jgi:peroxiredoxin
MPAEVGDKAPDFTLRSHTGEDITLSQYLGEKTVVLQTHVASFTGG